MNVGDGASLQAIQGTLNIEDVPDYVTLNLDDSADAAAPVNFVSWTAGMATIGADNDFTAGQTVHVAGVDRIFGLSGDYTGYNGKFTVVSATAGSFTYALSTNPGGSGGTNEGSVSRAVNISSFQGSDGLYEHVTGLAAAPIDFRAGDIDPTTGLTIKTSSSGFAGSVVNIGYNGANGVTTLISEGSDIVTVGANGNAQGVLGLLRIENPSFYSNLTVDDSADPTGRATVLDDINVNGGSFGIIEGGVLGGSLEYGANDVNTLTINGGSGGNSFTVFNSVLKSPILGGAAIPTTLNTGAGNDSVDVEVSSTSRYNLTINGQGGVNSLLVNDQAGPRRSRRGRRPPCRPARSSPSTSSTRPQVWKAA